jgi:arylformamidase
MNGSAPPAKIYLDYDQAALDRAYDQRAWADNAEAVIARYGTDSEAVRRRLPWRSVAYGQGASESFDLFPAEAAAAPLVVFLHGGAWRSLTKRDSGFAAAAFVAAGCHFIALDFDTIPALRLPAMAAQIGRALDWIHGHAGELGGDRRRLYLIGHSSGAHLAATALTAADRVRGAVLVSGSFDLVPVMLSARSAYLQLDAAEVAALSPIRHVGRIRCPVLVAHGTRESPEFERQSAAFAAALAAAGGRVETLLLAGANHFEAPLDLARPDSRLFRRVIAMIKEAAPGAAPGIGA